MKQPLLLKLFGSPQISYQGQPLTGFVSAKVRALLIYLAVTARPHSRDHLAHLLWEDTPASMKPNLRKALSNLRQLIGDLLVEEGKDLIALNAQRCWVDVVAFEHALKSGALTEAAQLYTADFLDGFNPSLSYEFEAWTLREQSRLKSGMVDLLRKLATQQETRHTLPEAIQTVRRLLALEPWQEESHRWLMELLARNGQRSAALAHFEVCKKVLREELDVEPAEETLRLIDNIQLFALHPTQVTNTKPNISLNPLPTQSTLLLGREEDQQRIVEMVMRAPGRLVTLVGPPGIGKTRLGLAVSEKLQSVFPDGVYFVPLAAITDVKLLPSSMIAALGLLRNSQQEHKSALFEFLQAKEALLMMDNFEQLVQGAVFLAELLSTCSKLRLLVTSRERLHVRAEYLYRVPPLGLSFANELFVERAQAVQPLLKIDSQNSATINTLCRDLDCLPLAIELVAAQSEFFSPKQLLERLKKRGLDIVSDAILDLPPRHRSLRSAIGSSYEMLDEQEQMLLRALSIFVDGFDGEAVIALGFNENVLRGLVNKNLVSIALGNYEEPRFLLLETIRQFAKEQLQQLGESDKWHNCHTLYFVALAENFGPYEPTSKTRYWYNRLTQDIENIRATFDWVIEHKNVELALRLLWPMRCYWGNWRDEDETLRFWMRKTVILAEDHWSHFTECSDGKIDNVEQRQIDLLNRAWYTVANLSSNLQELEKALQKGLSLNQLLAPNDVTTSLYHIIARVENERGDFERADEIFCKCLQIAQSMTSVPDHVRKNQIAWTIRMQGANYFCRGQLSQAQECLERSISLFNEIGQTFEANSTYIELHLAALYLNNFEQAEKYFQLYRQGLGENIDLFSDRFSRLKLLTEIRYKL